jgi:hypothetical protein
MAELGAANVLVGGRLAYRGYSKDRSVLQTTTGFLLIAGFACLGGAIYRVGVSLQ